MRDHRLTLRAGWTPDSRPCRLLARPGGAAGLKLLIVRVPLRPGRPASGENRRDGSAGPGMTASYLSRDGR